MTTEMVAIDKEALSKATKKGVTAAIILGILTVIEFFVAAGFEQPLWPLLPFVILKGWIILDSFMHIRALWHPEGH
jgi:hypothetical protein